MEKKVIKGADIIYRAEVKENVRKRWDEILESGWVILGKHTKEFEEIWAKQCGRKYGVAMSNDTAALEVAMKPELLNMKGKKMLIPAQGFFSIVTAMDRTGCEPWFVDIDIANNVNYTLQHVKDAHAHLGDKLGCVCIMPVGGLVNADALEIAAYCKENGIPVLEDAAHGHGSKIDGVEVGSIGDIACFSFYATKVLNCAEGGMLVHNNEEWDKEARLYRNYGRGGDFGISVIIRDGNNFRMHEFTAALGCEQAAVLDEILAERKRVAAVYDTIVRDSVSPDLLQMVPMSDGMDSNYYKYILLAPKGFTIEMKVDLKDRLKTKHGVELSGDVYDLPIHKQPIYLERYGHLDMPQSEEFAARHICLPFYEFMAESDMKFALEMIQIELEDVLRGK